jgi:hypothetical protein
MDLAGMRCRARVLMRDCSAVLAGVSTLSDSRDAVPMFRFP